MSNVLEDNPNGFNREGVPKDIFDLDKGQQALMYAASLDGGKVCDGWDDMGTCAVAFLNSCNRNLTLAIKVIKEADKQTRYSRSRLSSRRKP